MDIILKIESRIKEQFLNDSTGHDWHHIQRVLKLSRHLQSKEGGDLLTIELAALLHDISDHKFNGGDFKKGGKVAESILADFNVDDATINNVKYIVDNISYKGANTNVEMHSLEGQIVQDADRLDAIGAIGISRVFAYGGKNNQPIYDPELKPALHSTSEEYANAKTTSINHFYEKLLLLKERLNTSTAKEIGHSRNELMKTFLSDFYAEWEVNFSE